MDSLCRRLAVALLFTFLCVGVSAQPSPAPLVRVDETGIELHLLPQPELDLPLANTSSTAMEGDLTVALTYFMGNLAFSRAQQIHIDPGTAVQKIPLPAEQLAAANSPSGFGWYLLSYTVTSHPGSVFAAVHGTVQGARVLRDSFELRLSGMSTAPFGAKYPVTAWIHDPATGKPYAGVRVKFEMKANEGVYKPDRESVVHEVVTDALGYARTVFDLPASSKYASADITAEASIGSFRERQELHCWMESLPQLTLRTDKPIYQPEQKVHMRVLALGREKRAAANANVIFKITDRTGGEQFRATVATSRFGVAAADWEVPQKAVAGDYNIQAWIESKTESPGSGQGTSAYTTVRVSRYDLPEFVVEAAPDRSYYLPGQDATVEVRARYLTGEPVPQAVVKVTGGTERDGQLDAGGKFVTQISLKNSFAGFKMYPEQRFRDDQYTAYVTDASTGRSEERRFTLRLSHEPIHLYFFSVPSGPYLPPIILGGYRRREYLQLADSGPTRIYVTSSYADGTPASVEGAIAAGHPDETGKFSKQPDRPTWLASFHTNRYGVAVVELPRLSLSEDLLGKEPSYNRSNDWSALPDCAPVTLRAANGFPPARVVQLVLSATDKNGGSGSYQEEIRVLPPHDFLRVSTEHALYHAGDPIQVEIVSNTPAKDVMVDISAADGVVDSYTVRLNRGKASLTVPYHPRFQGKLAVRAFAATSAYTLHEALNGKAEVIYPARKELQVALHTPGTTFAPGELVNAELTVRRPDGRPAESELGVLVFDRAVAAFLSSHGNNYPLQLAQGFSVHEYFQQGYYSELAGMSYRDLLNLDPGKPFPDGLDLLAKAILQTRQTDEGYFWTQSQLFHGGFDDYWKAILRGAGAVGEAFTDPLNPLRNVLHALYESTGKYPSNEAELAAELEQYGVRLDDVRDPWGVRYRSLFLTDGTLDVLRLVSSGPDKKFDTEDDALVLEMSWPHFRSIGLAIDAATADFHKRTGGFIRDYPALSAELKARNIDLDSLHDPWGRPYTYTFEVRGPEYLIQVDSSGANGKVEKKDDPYSDDVHLWTSSLNYFQEQLDGLNRVIMDHFARTGQFPKNELEVKAILEEAKLPRESLLDPWGHPYYFWFREESVYGDRTTPQPGPAGTMNQITPMTQKVLDLYVSSPGPEPNHGFTLATFRKVLSEQSSKEEKPRPTPERPLGLQPDQWRGSRADTDENKVETATFGGQQQPSGNTSGIGGTVSDASGRVMVGVAVSAMAADTGKRYNTTTDKAGAFRFVDLPLGLYRVELVALPFERRSVTGVTVQPKATALVNAQLKSGRCMMRLTGLTTFGQNASTVEVTASAAITGVNRMAGPAVDNKQERTQPEKPLFTPRVRQYFPETLLWQPEVLTDPQGKAHISFPMADSLTAWTMSVVASNEDGQIGVAEQELRSFQPFFIEDDPPKVLTQGDQISLPVVFRNYSQKRQTVEAELAPQPWFTLTSGSRQNVTIAPNGNTSALFGFRADSSVRHGKQKVTARNTETGDAVEREVRVHPNGQEIAFSTAKLLAGEDNSFDIQLPVEMIEGSNDTELRIYPNLVAHVLDAVESLGKPPARCTEGFISRGYASLLTLAILRKAGQDNSDPQNPRAALAASSRAWLQLEYQALVASQGADGGYVGWNGKPSAAVTAYVLRFLRKAEDFMPVDQEVISRAGKFLATRQTQSGAWLTEFWWEKEGMENPNLTAYVARALAVATSSSQRTRRPELNQAFDRAMTYLEGQIKSWSDAWLVGNYGIAAAVAGRREYMGRASEFLRQLSHNEGATTYWNLEANSTPFDTWGTAGRVETTAVAVEALSMLQAEPPDPDAVEQIRRGLQFLLSHKDARASWYSIHGTQSVIEAIIAAMPAMPETSGAAQARIIVNGQTVSTIELPPANAVVGPVTLELAEYLNKGANKLQVVRTSGAAVMNVTALTSYYIPWSNSAAGEEQTLLPGDTRALRLKVKYDRSDPQPNQLVRCQVEVERIGFKGYGVMQAEIGLPPGADVDLESLTHNAPAHEIRPDRIVFYVWPSPAGSKFDFQFRLRYPIDAQAAPSMLYDYYNPESNATVRPTKFSVRPLRPEVASGSR